MGNAGHTTMFREGLRNECRRRYLVAYRMPTPPAHPMNDGLSLYPQAGAVSCDRWLQIASKKPRFSPMFLSWAGREPAPGNTKFTLGFPHQVLHFW
jgi:hypothetical protein